jgi:hypothetical protein
MLVSRQELSFDFKGARFDLGRADDRKLLAWIFNQFLYGEVTGIQCGHWLFHAPTLGAASFLAKQAGEEFGHVRKFLRIFSLLGEKPGEAHWAVRFLTTGLMGGSTTAAWGEHVALEMALGEGLVLTVFYAMIATMPEGEIRKILESSAPEEERHVEFGERETQAFLAAHPGERTHLLGLAVVQVWGLQRLKRFVMKSLARDQSHPVLAQFDSFYDHVIATFQSRIERLGLCEGKLVALSPLRKLALVAAIPFHKLRARLSGRAKLLTATYLSDPSLRLEAQRFQALAGASEPAAE